MAAQVLAAVLSQPRVESLPSGTARELDAGVQAYGTNAVVLIGQSVISGNTDGYANPFGGVLKTFGKNQIVDTGSGTLTSIGQK